MVKNEGASPRHICIAHSGLTAFDVSAPANPDLTFPRSSACASTSVTDHGGPKAVGRPVRLIFWGDVWNALANPDGAGGLLKDALIHSVQSLLYGPWFSGLRQYGVFRCPLGDVRVVDSSGLPSDPHTYDKGDVENKLQDLIDGGMFPEPDEPGGAALYMVLMPPNTSPAKVDGLSIAGEHGHFHTGSIIDADTMWYAFVSWGTLDDMMRAFSHELAEMCTDPTDDGWKIDGADTGCTEIGDVCLGQVGRLNGVNVEAYWSKLDGACLIPTRWTVRRTLAFAGKRLNGKGLRSLEDPLLSLTKLITSI